MITDMEKPVTTFSDIDLDNLWELVKEPEAKTEPVPSPEPTPDAVPSEPVEEPEVNQEPVPVEEPTPEPSQDAEEILRKALFETNADIETAKENAQQSWNTELVKQLEALETSLEEERLARSKLEMSNKVKDDELWRLSEQNSLLETENVQKKRIYWAIDEDQDLQAAVVYGIQSKNKPEYKWKFLDALKSLLRREWYDVDALQQKIVTNEKVALTEGNQEVPTWTAWAKPAGSVMDMFETME